MFCPHYLLLYLNFFTKLKIMKEFKHFLDSSTIHGVQHVSSERSCFRLIWIFVIVCGFSISFYLINNSFSNWNQSPITTTIETVPITQMTFPKITVCPPRNTKTNINVDLIEAENIDFDEDTRNELLNFARDVIQDDFYNQMMTNLSKLHEENRYFNWYQGYSELKYPLIDSMGRVSYIVKTSATSGSVATQYFSEKFNPHNIDPKVYFGMTFIVPDELKHDANYTLFLKIEKEPLDSTGVKEKMKFGIMSTIDPKLRHFTKNITKSTSRISNSYLIRFERGFSEDDLNIVQADLMPGFKINWYFNKHLDSPNLFKNYGRNKEFVRYMNITYQHNLA